MKKALSIISILLTTCSISAYAQSPVQAPIVEKKLTICGGADGGRYQAYAANLGKAYNDGRPKGRSSVTEIMTTGGSYDNVEKLLDNTCQAGIAQFDVLSSVIASKAQAKMNFEIAAKPFDESVHIICPKSSNVSTLSQIAKQPNKFIMLVGAETGGSYSTWQRIASTDLNLSKMPISNRGGVRGLNSVSEEGSLEDPNGERRSACMVWVGAQGAPFMMDDVSSRANKVKLISVDIDKVFELKNQKGEFLYRGDDQGYKSYPALFADWSGMFSSNPKMPVTSAVIIFRSDWIENNEGDYARLSRLINASNNKK